MKKFRKLIPAFCMLLVSAVLLGTSTYAWFSMNKNVTASGMQVNAKSDSIWLQITNADGASVDTNKTQANGKTATATVYPARWNPAENGAEGWQTASSNDPAKADKAGNYTDVASDDYDNYRLANTFKISAQNESGTGKNLKVKTCKVTGTSAFLDAVSVVVVCGTNVQTISASGKTSGTAFDIAEATVLAATVTHDETTVNVYIYIDGDNSTVYTNNLKAANVTGISVELTFGVD